MYGQVAPLMGFSRIAVFVVTLSPGLILMRATHFLPGRSVRVEVVMSGQHAAVGADHGDVEETGDAACSSAVFDAVK